MLSFAQPAWLALLLLAIPILLLHMRRRRTIVVGSVQLWQSITVRSTAQRSRRMPPFSWTLLLQLLALLLAVLALAQPRITSGTASLDHLIAVIDNSVAMQASGDMTAARQELTQAVTDRQPAAISVLLTDAPAPVAMARVALADQANWLNRLPEQAAFGAADWQAMDEAVRGLVNAEESTELLVLGSPLSSVPTMLAGQAVSHSTIAGQQTPAWLQGTRVVETAAGHELQGTVRRAVEDVDESISLTLSFRAFGDSDYLIWSEHELAPGDLDSLDDGLDGFTIPVELPLSGVLRVQLAAVEPGPLSVANHVVHVQPVQARVLLLGAAAPQLVRAIAAVEGVALYSADSLEQAPAENFDLVVTSGLPLQAVPNSNVLSFMAPDSDPLRAPIKTHWSTIHPLSQGVNWSAVEVATAARLPLLPGAEEVLVGNGLPLVQARTTPAGRQVAVAFDLTGSNWPEMTGFPAFVGNVLAWVLPELNGTTPLACEAGQDCAVSGANLGHSTHLLTEDGERIDLVQAGPTVLDFVTPLEPGVIWPQSQSGQPVRPFAINPAAVPTVASVADAAPLTEPRTSMNVDLRNPLLISLAVVLVIEALLVFSRLRGTGLRGPARRRHYQGLFLRTVTVALVALAASNLTLPVPGSREQVVVLVGNDLDSDPLRISLLEQVRAVAGSAGRSRSLDLISYGNHASLLLVDQADLHEPSAGANLQAGLDLALAVLDPELTGRVILASDGMQTGGDFREVLPRLTSRSTSVDVLPLSARPAGEVQVERVLAPEQVYAHDRFTLHATVTADTEVEAVLRFYRDGELLAEREQRLRAGRNIVDLLVTEPEAAEVLFEVEVDAAGDAHSGNNRDGVYLQVLPPANVLVVARQTEWGEVFADALRLQGLGVTVVRPDRAPYYLDGWLGYRGVVLLDVPSIDLTVGQQELLEQAVAEHGRGLLILGGPNSFGPGGYFETVLERLSPLSSRVPQDAPNVALVFVLDRSGSMQQSVEESTNRLDIARQATITAAGLLHEESRVSVIAFDSEASVLVPLQDSLDIGEIETALQFLEPGGGTSIYPGLAEAFEQLQDVDAAARHVIVMSDGLSQPGDFETLLGEMTEEGITVSTVAIGDGADISSLQRHARMGGGAFHATRDFRALPSILSQESMMLSGAPIEENEAQPTWINRKQAFMQGLPESVPRVTGFVLTTAKDDATVHIEVPDSEGEEFPLLASWRYGNGQVMAFTSQAAGSWTSDWISLPDYPLFWSQALRNFLPSAGQEGINLSLHRTGDELTITIEVLDEFESRISGQDVTVNGLPLRETSLGIYQGSASLTEPGRLELEIVAGETSLTRNFHAGYPARLDFSLADPDALITLAEASGGRILQGGEPLFTGGQRYWFAWPLWPLLVLLGLVVFMLELVSRYDPALLRKERRA